MSNKEQKTAPGAAIVGGGKVEKQRGQASSFSIANHTTAVRESQDAPQKLTAFLVDSRDYLADKQVILLENLSVADLSALASIVSNSPNVQLVADIGNIMDLEYGPARPRRR